MQLRVNHSMYFFLLIWSFPWAIHTSAMGQRGKGQIIDAETGFVIPFVKVESNTESVFSAYDGEFSYSPGDSLYFTHPVYEARGITTDPGDSTLIVELNYNPPPGDEESEKKALEIIWAFQANTPKNDPKNITGYEFLTDNYIQLYKRKRKDPDMSWQATRSMTSLEKNRYKFHDKYFHKTLNSRFSDADTSNIKFIPVSTYTLSPYNEFIRLGKLEYLNPLHPSAKKKYRYFELETFIYRDIRYHVIYIRPKEKKHFLGFHGLYYITENNYGLAAAVFTTVPLKSEYTQCVVTYQLTEKDIWLGENIHLEAIFEHEPGYNEDMKLVLRSMNSSINFNIDDQSDSKWLGMIFFDKKDTKFQKESWSMDEVNMNTSEKMSYIEKDTVTGGFVRKDWTSWVYDIYMGRLTFRLPYVNIKNILSVNRYEYLRLGIGMQTHKQFSDIFTAGGYAGYGFKDKEFKYGANAGFYLGNKRSTILTYEISKDILEPGRTEYFEQQKNYLREFYSKNMDNICSQAIRFKAVLNRKFDAGIKLSKFNLEPTYTYTYMPLAENGGDTTRMYFTELLFQARIGHPRTFDANVRKLFYPNKSVFSNFYLNLAKGFNDVFNGNYSYWKANARLFVFMDFEQKGAFNVMLEGGIMTVDQPIQIDYIAPGNDVELAGIIVKNAFQTMQLYRYLSDRYINAFLEYDFGNILFSKTKFNPGLAVALNVGWGVFSGNPALHRGFEINDYGTGYYETGVLINNLLKAKLFNYIYGGLGLGVYYAIKNPGESSKWAIRLTYTLGTI